MFQDSYKFIVIEINLVSCVRYKSVSFFLSDLPLCGSVNRDRLLPAIEIYHCIPTKSKGVKKEGIKNLTIYYLYHPTIRLFYQIFFLYTQSL